MPESLSQLTREQLYDRVWLTSLPRLAVEFGTSAPAIGTHCRKLNIPTPPRGYWSKLEFGKAPPRPPLLPPVPTPPAPVRMPPSDSPWPHEVSRLCERAHLLIATLQKDKPNYRGLQSAHVPYCPRTDVSQNLVEATARAYHAILTIVEGSGVMYRKARGKYDSAYFEHQKGRLYLSIEEPVVTLPAASTWAPRKEGGSGKLTLTLADSSYGRSWHRSWQEGKEGTIREIVAKLAAAIPEYYREQEKKRTEEAAAQESARQRWVQENEDRKRCAHAQTLVDAQQTRKLDLFRAAGWARLHADLETFLNECEKRWSTAEELNAEQRTWLDWARTTAKAWSPWDTGYPAPGRDGAFDPTQVPFGGPYPPLRNFPRPPTMPEVPKSEDSPAFGARKEPYPFWLRHPR
jgi:hypothetical protein